MSEAIDDGRALIIVYTGNGKGKTTAALGLAFRALGRGKRVFMVQFIKGSWVSGEIEAVKRFAPQMEIVPMGKGFVPAPEDKSHLQHVDAARQAWNLGVQKAESGSYDLLILDEINNALSYGMLDLQEVLEFLRRKPHGLHVVLTGRGAPAELLDLADLVTEMREVKHPYRKGIRAREGIDY